MAANREHTLPAAVVARVRQVCLAFPSAVEEQAWVGLRWAVRGTAFAHLLVVDATWPPAYARAVPVDGPTPVLTFRVQGAELAALTAAGPPFHKPPWHPAQICLTLDAATDWTEVGELLTDSWLTVAPARLRAQL